MANEIPEWACNHWGGWGHDWLDCSECLMNYEQWLEANDEHLSDYDRNGPPAPLDQETCDWKKEGF